MHPRILIIATTPYSENYSSRSLDAYFHYWEKENVAQIFTRNIIPTKGHCRELYQISDARLVNRWLHKTKQTGRLFLYEDLEDSGENVVTDNGTMQQLGKKHTPLIEVTRRILWRKKYWCTSQLNEWLDQFNPECIFYNFSNHIFTQQIALYVAERYKIPIVTAIGDDFYFNDQKSYSPIYILYRKIFKCLSRQILTREKSSAVYVNDKIRDKYNSEFGLKGETIYFNSTVERRQFAPVNPDNPVISYFGNIRLGRNNSLIDIANALNIINNGYKLSVYASESDPMYYKPLVDHPNIDYKGSIPYSEVKQRIAECDIFVVVEGFEEEDLAFTRYSLSTKAADSLASGCAILAYGPKEAGVIDYLESTGAAFVCHETDGLEEIISSILLNSALQREKYEYAIAAYKQNHTLESSSKRFEKIVNSAIG